MKVYTRFKLYERKGLSRYLAMNYCYRQIVNILSRPVCTISREINNRGFNRLNYRTDFRVRRTVVEHLELRWSLEKIANRLKVLCPKDMDMHVSHETIYAYSYIHPRGSLKRRMAANFARKHINRRVRDKERKKSAPIQDYFRIDDHPEEVKDRKIAGHYQ